MGLPAGAAAGAVGRNQFRTLCQAEYLNFLRVREWQDLHSQLRQARGELGIAHATDEAADADAVHRALLAGLLSHIGLRDADTQRVPRAPASARFAIAPGSALADEAARRG